MCTNFQLWLCIINLSFFWLCKLGPWLICNSYDKWLKSMDKKELVGIVLLDFTAAFNVIDYSILIAKLCTEHASRLGISWADDCRWQKAKLLGIKLDHLLSWSDQIIILKLGEKALQFQGNALLMFHLLSHLEYCPIIWSSVAAKHLNKFHRTEQPDQFSIILSTLYYSYQNKTGNTT